MDRTAARRTDEHPGVVFRDGATGSWTRLGGVLGGQRALCLRGCRRGQRLRRTRGRGVGKALMTALIESSAHAGIWTLQSGIFPENTGSIALHEAVGFRIVGRRERIGQHHGR